MPQTNVAYDTPYNRRIVAEGKLMLNKHFASAGNAYAPTDMGFKLSNFHNDYSQEPKLREMIGGGSPYPQKFLLSGNSPSYPPASMSSGLAVSSGGSHLAGLDGAVGGYSASDFFGDVAHVGKQVAPDLIRAYLKSGEGRRGKKKGGDLRDDIKKGITTAGKTILKFAPFLGLGRRGGSEVGDKIGQVFKTLAPFAPLLMGLGHGEPTSKQDVVNALKHVGAKATHSLPKLAEVALRGGYDISDFGNDVADVVKGIIGLGRTKKGGKKAKGGLSLSDVLESAKPAISKAVAVAKPIAKQVAKDLGEKAIEAVASKAKSTLASKVGSGGGRSKRAEIVRKIMKEKGMKMIEASKYVKAHNLY
jgi:hypothetical protein